MRFVLAGLILGGTLVGIMLWTDSALPPAIAIHAALMLLAWGAMIPLGGVVARYYKVTPGQDFPAVTDNPFWWNWHRLLQYGGIALASLGLAAVLRETGGHFNTLHGRCGIVVMGVGWLQILSAAVRGTKGGPTDARATPGNPSTWRGDHYDMSPRRRWFEAWHKTAGWSVIALAAVTIALGIHLAGDPPWLLVVAGCLAVVAVLGIIDGIVRSRWTDTYAALWGTDPVHPGNRRRIGRRWPFRRAGQP